MKTVKQFLDEAIALYLAQFRAPVAVVKSSACRLEAGDPSAARDGGAPKIRLCKSADCRHPIGNDPLVNYCEECVFRMCER